MPMIKSLLNKSRPLYWIAAGSMVMDAVKTMTQHDVGALPVLESDRLVGVFSERDLMKRVIVKGLDPAKTTVASVMTTDMITADINDDDATALKKMTSRQCRHLPVIDNNKLVGFLSARDLMKREVEGKELEIKALTDYIYYVPPTP
ncbi:MAG: CBS domain-containing protein [candidate division Zixibacteria bacterium]|nr:CBS domain-containing protein [candidate division Zixibacteria bacterium]